MEQHLPDLVRDSKLEAQVLSDHVIQVDFISDPSRGQWRTRVEQQWRRKWKLGQGAFSTVWLDECVSGPGAGQLRAVKEVWKGRSNLLGFNYYRELETIAKFSQKRYRDFFARAFGWYETDSAVYIAMEFFHLGDLGNFLGSLIPESEVCRMMRQLVEGVNFMHDHKIAHRDLKPANIFVYQKSPRWWVKIGDFGISKRIEETALRTRIGTEAYLAPEVLGFHTPDSKPEDHTTFSLAVDIWSLGAIAHEMLVGERAFPDLPSLVGYVMFQKPFPQVSPCPSSEAVQFLQSAMAASPSSRLTAAQAVEHPWLVIEPEPGGGEEPEESVGYEAVPPHAGYETGGSVVSTPPVTAQWTDLRDEHDEMTLKMKGLLLGNQQTQQKQGSQTPTESNPEHHFASDHSGKWQEQRQGRIFRVTQRLTKEAWGPRRACFSFSPDRKFLAMACGSSVELWSMENPSHPVHIETQQANARGVAFSPDGRHLASVSYHIKGTQTVQLWAVLGHGFETRLVLLWSQGRDVWGEKGIGQERRTATVFAIDPVGKLRTSVSIELSRRASSSEPCVYPWDAAIIATDDSGKVFIATQSQPEGEIGLWLLSYSPRNGWVGEHQQALVNIPWSAACGVANSPPGRLYVFNYDAKAIDVFSRNDPRRRLVSRPIEIPFDGMQQRAYNLVVVSPDGRFLAVQLWDEGDNSHMLVWEFDEGHYIYKLVQDLSLGDHGGESQSHYLVGISPTYPSLNAPALLTVDSECSPSIWTLEG